MRCPRSPPPTPRSCSPLWPPPPTRPCGAFGDPHQAQSVRAGGLGAELARLGTAGEIPAPQLTENRRQLDPAERHALALYRAGLIATSQAIRRHHGWEHDLGSPHATREALAATVVADIATHGPTGVVALAISHDHGGVLADQRTPEREVLDALRRQPDTGFAVHDAPSRVERLLAEQAALRSTLNHRPPDQRPALRQAELALASAKKELYWANHRLEAAEKRLGELGPLSQLRRHGRNQKTSSRSAVSPTTSNGPMRKLPGNQRDVDEFRSEVNQRHEWDAEHGWPDSRLHSIDTELAELGRSGLHIVGTTRDRGYTGPSLGRKPAWLERLAEIAAPPRPGPDHGIDLGL